MEKEIVLSSLVLSSASSIVAVTTFFRKRWKRIEIISVLLLNYPWNIAKLRRGDGENFPKPFRSFLDCFVLTKVEGFFVDMTLINEDHLLSAARRSDSADLLHRNPWKMKIKQKQANKSTNHWIFMPMPYPLDTLSEKEENKIKNHQALIITQLCQPRK